MRVVEKGAWLSTIAAALGVAVASCKKDAPADPALSVHEITQDASVAAATTAPSIDASDAALEAAVGIEQPDASPDASTKVVTAKTADPFESLLGTTGGGGILVIDGGGLGRIGNAHASCGAVSCGVTTNQRGPQASVSLSINGAQGKDEQTIRAHISTLRRCASLGLQSDPSMQGTVNLRMQIDAAAAITITTQSNNGLSAQVVTCMTGALRRLELEKLGVRVVDVRVQQVVQE